MDISEKSLHISFVDLIGVFAVFPLFLAPYYYYYLNYIFISLFKEIASPLIVPRNFCRSEKKSEQHL